MPVVFSSHSQVAHQWATQSQPFGRSPTPSGSGGYFCNGNESADCPRVRFIGRLYYSYQTPIARLEPIPGRPETFCLLVVPNEWGPATGGHIGDATSAVRHLVPGRVFTVPHIGGYSAGADYWQRKGGLDERGLVPNPSAIDHLENYGHLVRAYDSAASTFLKERGDIWRGFIEGHKWEPGQDSDAGRLSEAETVARDLCGLWSQASAYAEYFGPFCRPVSFPASLAEVEAVAAGIMAARAERAARALAKLTPRELARREAAKVQRAANAERLKALRFADSTEKLQAWREGLRVETYALPRSEAAYIRATGVKRDKAGAITGGTLETSQGARVPLVQAIRVFQFLKCVKERGEGWRPSGLHGIRVGAFAVSHIEPSGDFVAGCHSFAWPEISALAETLGVFGLPCAQEALS